MAVILNTSLGDIVIDLHTDKCPLTSKNFLKLCKLKYYSNCIFHDVKKDFIAQTGDPTGTGSGGDSVYKLLYGNQARFFNDECHPKLTHEKIGTVAMASAGENLNASQFYITLRAGLDYLDGKHTVFGEVAEGLDTLMRISEAYVDSKGRPYKNIRIKHVDILDDPFDDPPQLDELIPDKSPEVKPAAEGEEVRLEDDWVPMDEQMDPEELDKSIRSKEAHSRAVVLEMIGDIPEAEVAPPENVLFVCKLNPVTEDGDLETIFLRFGKVVAADIIRDYKTGDSLCYGFIEFENKEACEAAYFKMDNVLIDDRRIHVDFSQSVSKLWTRFRKFGTKDANGQGAGSGQGKGAGCFNCGEYGHLKKDCPNESFSNAEQDAVPVEKPKYTLKEPAGQRGNPLDRYEMVFENSEASHSHPIEVSGNSTASHSKPRKLSERRLDEHDNEKRAWSRSSTKESVDDRSPRSRRKDGPRNRYVHGKLDSEDDHHRRSGPPSSSRHGVDDRSPRSRRKEGPRNRYVHGKLDSEDDHHQRSGPPSSFSDGVDDRSPRSRRKVNSEDDHHRRLGPPSLTRHGADDKQDSSGRSEKYRDRFLDARAAPQSLLSRERPNDSRDYSQGHERPRNRNMADRHQVEDDTRKRLLPPVPSKEISSDKRYRSTGSERARERNEDEPLDSDDQNQPRSGQSRDRYRQKR